MVLKRLFVFSVSYTCHNKVKLRSLRMVAFRRGLGSLSAAETNEATFKKVLIANRGEIACRIIRTAKRMGIRTVAVYSVADSQAKHVKLADEAIFIGPSPAIESYLDFEKILNAIKETGADAVHPGYGFLSENPKFVQALEAENITFIGPSADAISRMGDKLQSKRMAVAAGVNIIPGVDAIVADVDDCVLVANHIGYPVMIKASAGGGGKGMRIARNDQETREGYLLASQEAEAGFGDKRLLVEKFIEDPRHIEIQILADKHGNVIHLNERDCSIQRRNQKVIEEAPSVFLDNATRETMGQQAIALCKELNYSSAGTIEFLIDQRRNFYFLEMNTRLQVEHPITECITNIDIVEQMFRIAMGCQLNIKQEDVKIDGWAIENRIYAEDPYRSFGIPSIGRIHEYKEPNHIEGIRCDSGIEEGSKISMYYDPLISKLISHGRTRQEAIEKCTRALDSYVIRGITNNIPLLRDVLTEENFRTGRISTNYLPTIYPDGFKGLSLTVREKHKLVAVAGALFASNQIRSKSLINYSEFRKRTKVKEDWKLSIRLDEEVFSVNVSDGNGLFKCKVNANWLEIDKNGINLAKSLLELEIDRERDIFQIISKNAVGDYHLIFRGNNYKLKILTQKAMDYHGLMTKKGENYKVNKLKSPMSGLVKSLSCTEGESVVEGQELCVLEAMKMQNLITAPSNGTIKEIKFNVGEKVTEGDVLIKFE
ncbi:propionyl-CoA carboxylase alpha chain, mitochondrial-like [Rhynchophorus ferrugineus]|uniref:propionyl-CoA carboxylase alpha chain, mitochondrial-like n=1 Tax=Rhynchophorus ferrugineus TaxID=354439 RepID=UPI003FCEBF75